MVVHADDISSADPRTVPVQVLSKIGPLRIMEKMFMEASGTNTVMEICTEVKHPLIPGWSGFTFCFCGKRANFQFNVADSSKTDDLHRRRHGQVHLQRACNKFKTTSGRQELNTHLVNMRILVWKLIPQRETSCKKTKPELDFQHP